MTSFNRQKPLLERKRVPCELIISSPSASTNSGGGKTVSRTKVFYTLRLLEGQRPTRNVSGGTERAIRLELSDEYSKCHGLTLMEDSASTVGPPFFQNNNFYGPPFLSSPKGTSSSGGNIRIPNTIGSVGLNSCASPWRRKAETFGNDDHRHAQHGVTVSSVATPTNPIHLYDLEVGESDFSDLQQDQALLVEFSNFAKSFIDLLRQCDLGETDEHSSQSNNPSSDWKGHDHPPSFMESNSNHVNPYMKMGCDSSEPNYMFDHNPIHRGYHQRQSASCMNPTMQASEGNETSCTSKYFCRIEDFTGVHQGGGGTKWNGSQKNANIMARFSIVESNQFRELTHLSLNLKSGTDESIRSYLSTRLVETLGMNAVYNLKLQKERNRIDEAEKAYNDITLQYNELLKHTEKERNVLAQEAGETIHKEQTRRLEDMQTVQKEKDLEIAKIKDDSEQQIQALQSMVEELKEKNAQMEEDKLDMEQKNQRLANALTDKEKCLQKQTSRLSTIQDELDCVQRDKTELEVRFHESQQHVHKTEQSELELCRSKLVERIKENQALQKEFDQTKELLERYQRDRQEMKRRMKSKVELIRKQEEFLSAKDIEASETQEREDSLSRDIERLRNNLHCTENALSESKQQLEERQKTIDNNEKVISWLNKQLSDAAAAIVASKATNTSLCNSSTGSIGSVTRMMETDLKDYVDQKTTNSNRLAHYTSSVVHPMENHMNVPPSGNKRVCSPTPSRTSSHGYLNGSTRSQPEQNGGHNPSSTKKSKHDMLPGSTTASSLTSSTPPPLQQNHPTAKMMMSGSSDAGPPASGSIKNDGSIKVLPSAPSFPPQSLSSVSSIEPRQFVPTCYSSRKKK